MKPSARRGRRNSASGAANRMLDYTRTLVLYPNTLFIEQRRVIRTTFPTAPDQSKVTGYPLMPAVDDPIVRKQRLDIYLSFLGPAGFAERGIGRLEPEDIRQIVGAHEAAMRRIEMIDVDGVLHQHLPIGAHRVLMRAGQDDAAALILIEDHVEQIPRFGEVFD